MNGRIDLRSETDHWQQSQAIVRRVREELAFRFPIVLPRSFNLERAKRVRGLVIEELGERRP